jgi:hypothetical protein
LIAVCGLQWCCHQIRDLRCTHTLETLERNSHHFLESVAVSLEQHQDAEAGWNESVTEASRAAALPAGFSVVLVEMVQDSGNAVRAHVVCRFPTHGDSVWERLSQPLSIPGLATVRMRSLQSYPIQSGDWESLLTPLENPWIQEFIWPLEWVSLSHRLQKAESSNGSWFLLLTCRPDAVEFGARWATPCNLGLAATVDPGAQPSNPSRDRMALTVHAIRWFGVPRSFVVVDQGFRSSGRSAGEAISEASRTIAMSVPSLGVRGQALTTIQK